jgi:hypothetical protein
MREIHGHEGSTLNNAITIHASERDENGGAHTYSISLPELPDLLTLGFQNGPLKEAGLNGISDEALIAIVIDRLEGFNTGPFRCRENSLAITNLEQALMWLQKRTAGRQRRGVEGTHQV